MISDSTDPVVQAMYTNNGLFAELHAGGGMRRHEAEEMFIAHLVGYDVHGIEGPLWGNVELDYCKNCKKKLSEHNHAFVGGQGTEDIPSSCQGDVLKHYTPKRVTLASQTPLAGSTVGFDRRWLKEHMPKLEALFSYRSVDCSSLTELAKRWAPSVYEARPRAEHAAHRALADVRESISLLRFYRDRGFVGGGNFA